LVASIVLISWFTSNLGLVLGSKPHLGLWPHKFHQPRRMLGILPALLGVQTHTETLSPQCQPYHRNSFPKVLSL
jgi:hypothetical protein